MGPEAIGTLAATLIAFAALALNLEQRINDRPKVRINFRDKALGVYADTGSQEFVPETVSTGFWAINSGRRGTSILDLRCFVVLNASRYELLNGSTTIYKTLSLPLGLPNDNARLIEVDWILPKVEGLEEYNHRFSLLPSGASYELQVLLANNEVFTKQYGHHDFEILPFDVAQSYRQAGQGE